MLGDLLSKKHTHFLLIVLCTLITFALQFNFRAFDDNRLTSWKWAFEDANMAWYLPVLLVVIFILYFLIKYSSARRGLFLTVFSFAASAAFWSTPEVIVDASRYFTQAKHLEVYGMGSFVREWGGSINAWTDMPLAPFLYGILFKCFGESRTVIQIFTSFLFSMTVLLTYLTGKRLWDEETGFFAGLLLLGIPYVFSQTPLMLVDVPTMFFLTLSVFTFICAIEKGGAWTFVSAAAVFCAAFVKYSTWMMLSILPVVFFVYLLKGQVTRKKIFYRGLSIAAIAGVLIGIVIIYKYDVISGQMAFLREYQAPGLRRWGESFFSTFLFQVHPFITLAGLYSFYHAFRKRDLKFLIISWLIILIVAMQIKRSRYVLIAFPMLVLMASYGLQKIKEIEIKRFIASCIVASSLVVAVFAYQPFLQSMSLVNLKDAGVFLDSVKTERVEVYTTYSTGSIVNPAVAVPILDLFTEKNIAYHHDPDLTLPFEKIEKSPLRFTWEYKNPEYYSPDQSVKDGNSAVVVISNRPLRDVPDDISEKIKGYKAARVFSTSTGIFRYSPVVSVYQRDDTGKQ
ncbi:MAG TPA: glycosyltransferase family 39 protein [Nitrospirae bacterium]|nr:glycosyltransferase family 39 protein [Nitrospirota bacterium]